MAPGAPHSPDDESTTMTDMLTQLLAEERTRQMRAKFREAEMQRAWRAKPTRPSFNHRFRRR